MNRILELYGISTQVEEEIDWELVSSQQNCPYLGRKCLKNRKSFPEITIGTCSVAHGRNRQGVIICPIRLLERNQVFFDCIHLLTLHEPGNELHIVSELSVPGGNVDYFLVSAQGGKVRDFIGIELQTLDTTGTVWPERQRFLQEKEIEVDAEDVSSTRSFGMNWKMTAKTILVQLHHKIETFQSINKHLVLIIQNHFLDYMQKAFQFEHIGYARLGDSMHIHTYNLSQTEDKDLRLGLDTRYSTDANGIAASLGLKADANLELQEILELLEAKISEHTRLAL